MMSKTDFLLLRGLGRDQRHWGEFREMLNSKEYTGSIYALDFPGVGTEADRDSPVSIGGIVDDLEERFSALELKSKPIIVAISMGAMAALEWMKRNQEAFSGAILINTSARNLCSLAERLDLGVLKDIVRLLSVDDLNLRESFIVNRVSNLDAETRLRKQADWTAFANEIHVKKKTWIYQLLAATRFKAPLKFNQKCLFLASENDRLVNSVCSKKIAANYGVPCLMHKTAGHDLPMDDPNWLCDRITDFVKEIS